MLVRFHPEAQIPFGVGSHVIFTRRVKNKKIIFSLIGYLIVEELGDRGRRPGVLKCPGKMKMGLSRLTELK